MTAVRQHPMVAGTSTTEGLVSYVVNGAWPPFLPFSSIPDGRTIRYVATDGQAFEEGRGVKSAGPTLSRATILRTSGGDTDKIDWGTGTRVVYPVPDIDTVYEYETEGPAARFLAPIQLESGGKKFRLWTSSGVLRISDVTDDPFVNMFIYNALAATPKFQVQVRANFVAGAELGGVLMQAPATSPFASETEAKAGTADNRVVTPLGVAQALTIGGLVIGNRPSLPGEEIGDTDRLLLQLAAGALRRITIAGLKSRIGPKNFIEDWRTSWSNNTLYSAVHGLGGEANEVIMQARAKSGNNGYASGEIITLGGTPSSGTGGSNRHGITYTTTATGLHYRTASDGILHLRLDTAAQFTLSSGSWDLRILGRRWA